MSAVVLDNYAHGIDYPTSALADKKENGGGGHSHRFKHGILIQGATLMVTLKWMVRLYLFNNMA